MAETSTEKGPLPTDVSAAIFTETLEYFCIPVVKMICIHLIYAYCQLPRVPSMCNESVVAGTLNVRMVSFLTKFTISV